MDQKFDKDETQRRFEAALRGARIAGPKHNSKSDSEAGQEAIKETAQEWKAWIIGLKG